MLYGLSMPLLWPLAALAIMNLRFTDRIAVAWIYKIPASMDDALTRQVVRLLRLGPIFLLFNGYWIVDSRQMFDNVWEYKNSAVETMPSLHLVEYRLTQSTPLLAIATAGLVAYILLVTIPEELIVRAGFTLKGGDVLVDEDLPNFFEAIRLMEADRILAENKTMQDRYGFELIECDVV